MNFKRNCSIIIALFSSVFMVASCTNAKIFQPYQNIEEVVDTHEEFVGPNNSYVKFGDYKSYPATNENGDIVELGSAYDVLTDYTGRNILKAEGDRKLLVVPVQFKDFTINTLNVNAEEYISNLNKAFFGYSKNNKYVSVAEYYNRSSYGKLRISGKVCDQFFTYPRTVYEINQNKPARKSVLDVYDRVLTWYKETYQDDLADYRIDPEHGNNDIAMYLVYTYPTEISTNNRSFFWAYTFNNKPLSWSSYSFLNTLSGSPDAHTFIHETGHLFGLVDYYPVEDLETSNSVPEPAGRIDMMDCSVGDHSALSKMWLNWTRPYWVKNSCEITIKALVDSGDLILINDNWNGTVFDEYYLIELYSPTGLNYFDTNVGNSAAKLPTLPGIKIHHVDARLGYYVKGDTNVFKHYCDEISEPGQPKIGPNKVTKNIDIVHDNVTYSEAKDSEEYLKNYLYELQLNHVGHSVYGCATNMHLFHQGDSLENLAFNKINAIDYKITVTSVNIREATIKIEKQI